MMVQLAPPHSGKALTAWPLSTAIKTEAKTDPPFLCAVSTSHHIFMMPFHAASPRPRNAQPQDSMAQMYTTHPSLARESPEHFAFPSPPRHANTTHGRRISTPDHRFKSENSESPSGLHPFSSSQRRASTPETIRCSPYDSRSHHPRTPETPKSRRADDRWFPGPLRIPEAPRFPVSPSSSPHNSPTSTLNTPSDFQRSPLSTSPLLLPSWRDTPFSDRLPPIRRFHASPRDELPHLSSARWHDDPSALRPSSFLETRSPTPSSPEGDEVALPKDTRSSFSSPRYEYPKYGSAIHVRDPERIQTHPHRSHDFNVEVDGRVNQDSFRSRASGIYSPGQNDERQQGPSQRRSNLSILQLSRPAHHSHAPCNHREESPPSGSRTKFGIRKGARFFCTYVSPLTGERCDTWDKGWSVYATLVRHAEAEHAHEELELIARGELGYDDAQIVTSREKKDRIEENLARTGCCPDCGTVFSSKRRDSLSRHRQTSACEKAQKRGRPPTKFPKKPKGPSFQVLDVDSAGETP